MLIILQIYIKYINKQKNIINNYNNKLYIILIY